MHVRWPMTTARVAFLLFLVLSLASLDSTSTLHTHRHSSVRTLARLPEGANFAHRTALLSTRAPSELVAGTRGLRNATHALHHLVPHRTASPRCSKLSTVVSG